MASPPASKAAPAAPPVPPAAGHGLAGETGLAARSLSADAVMFTGATYVAHLLLFVAGFIQKGLLGPLATGYWSLMQTFWTFFPVAPLGAHHGTARQIPMHRGVDDYRTASAVADTGGSFALIAYALVGTLLASVALAFGGGWPDELRYGLVLLGLTAPLRFLADYHEVLFQATKRFNVSSLNLLVRAAVVLALQTLLVWQFGFWGMWMGTIAVVLIWFALWGRLGLSSFRRPAFRLHVERARLGELISFGAPIMVNGELWQLFLAIDSLIVAGFIDVKSLGYYALALSVTSYVLFLPRSVGATIFPRMTEEYARTKSIEAIRHYATDTQRVLAYMLLPLFTGVIFFGLPVLIRHALPEFEPAVDVVLIMSSAAFFIALCNMPIKLLITAGYRWNVTAVTGVCFAFNAAVNLVAVGVLDWGLRGAAGATAISYVFTFALLTGYALTREASMSRMLRHAGELVGVALYVSGALWGVHFLLGESASGFWADAGLAAAKFALFVLLVSPFLWLAERRYAAFSRVRGLLGSLTAKLRRS